MSETISKKFMESISKIKSGHHISIISIGCETETNSSITYKFDVSDKGLSNIDMSWVDVDGNTINKAQQKYIISLLKVQWDVLQKSKKTMITQSTQPAAIQKSVNRKSTNRSKKSEVPNVELMNQNSGGNK